MDFLVLAVMIALAAHALKSRDQQRRIALLASHLGHFQIEKLMEKLTDGYLRCLDEDDPARREQIWRLLDSGEQDLADQFSRFAADFAKVGEAAARVSKLPFALPLADKLLPAGSFFDVRRAFAIHAQGIADAAANRQQQSPKAKAYLMSAELFLMQHTCHWYCKSKTVASARLLARHRTTYRLALDSVSPNTRAAYRALVGH